MSVALRIVVALPILSAIGHGNELKDYCTKYKFGNLPGGLAFTKEVVTTEYANVGAFKALHCCLRGYRSIEWYKDNRAYPWPGSTSHFILYPESANQTIYTQEMRTSDAGRYSCLARNDTTTLEGDITLAVLNEESGIYTGKPLPTYRPASQLVPLRGTARLFCEAYMGKVNLPDARNTVTWWKSGSNATLPGDGRIAQHRVSREDNQIIGSYLEIQNVLFTDYGEYKCIISNSVDEDITLAAHVYEQEPQFVLHLPNGSERKSLLLAVLVVVLLVSVTAFYTRCWLPVALLYRDKFGRLEENGSLEICSHANAARRVIMVLSPASLDNVWTDASVAGVLKQLSTLPARTIVVALQGMPGTTATIAKRSRRDRRDILDSGVFLDQLTILRWKDGGGGDGGRDFWYKLRLAMPAIRPVASETGCQSVAMIVQANGKCGQQKARSRESLEVLV